MQHYHADTLDLIMIITIEGNIGAGKSTFLSFLNENVPRINGKRVVVLSEKVDEWLAIVDPSTGRNLFDMFYTDPNQHAYVFQTYVLLSRVQHLIDFARLHTNDIIVCERGFMTDCVIFARSMRDKGTLSDLEWDVYQKWHKAVCNVFPMHIDGQIYLRATPDTCIQRIKHRARPGEENITRDYIEDLHNRHDEWLMSPSVPVPPTIIVDADADLVANETIRVNVATQITDFISQITHGLQESTTTLS